MQINPAIISFGLKDVLKRGTFRYLVKIEDVYFFGTPRKGILIRAIKFSFQLFDINTNHFNFGVVKLVTTFNCVNDKIEYSQSIECFIELKQNLNFFEIFHYKLILALLLENDLEIYNSNNPKDIINVNCF
ncbi:hypothetical protein BpHYR1_046941 [Brachionus plicatilis]|uniref:Uncharacterized protein n=1 Tax=Brachionus plicatilis TaxID=10195 RepID=A0A3M7RGH9_BRAPC|nr:hypothetical protein BpHYR1_046941 [Brachionus plicatilis]